MANIIVNTNCDCFFGSKIPSISKILQENSTIKKQTNNILVGIMIRACNAAVFALLLPRKQSFASALFSTSLAFRLQSLRKQMSNENIAALIVPSEDPHMSEYPAAIHNRREFISGFTGSSGTAVITDSEALLFTDGRYFEQAERFRLTTCLLSFPFIYHIYSFSTCQLYFTC